MTKNHSFTEKFELDELTVVANIDVELHYDRNYGSDANGSRGWGQWFIEDFEYYLEGKEELTLEQKAELEKGIQTFIINNCEV